MTELLLALHGNGTGTFNNTVITCFEESTKGPLGLALGVILTAGGVISYVPQHVALIRSKSVEGISWVWLFLNCLASFCQLVNVIVLRWDQLLCCNVVSFGGCQTILLGVYQVGAAILNLYPMFTFYVYLVRSGDDQISLPAWLLRICACLRKAKTTRWSRYSYFVFSFAIVLPLSVIAAVLTNLTGKSAASVSFGVAMGALASAVTLIMWLPQVVYTFRARSGGSLSIVMLLIQMPGNLGNAFFQAIVEQTGVSTFGPYLVSALAQLTLILMIVYFYFRGRRRKKPANPDDTEADWSSDTDVGERENLLTSEISRLAEGFANDFGDDMTSSRSRSNSRSNSRNGSSKKYEIV